MIQAIWVVFDFKPCNLVAAGECMHRPFYIFNKGGKVNNKVKLSALLGYKPSRSPKL